MSLPSTVIRLPSDPASALQYSAARKYAKSNWLQCYKSDIILLTQQADSGGNLARQRIALCAASEKGVLKDTVKQLGALESDRLVVFWRSLE